MTILMVTHDIEFCAEYADRCALFFDGEIVSCGTPKEFFSGNSFTPPRSTEWRDSGFQMPSHGRR